MASKVPTPQQQETDQYQAKSSNFNKVQPSYAWDELLQNKPYGGQQDDTYTLAGTKLQSIGTTSCCSNLSARLVRHDRRPQQPRQ